MLGYARLLRDRISGWHFASLLLMTLSVQGLVVGGQLLAALLLTPAEMGSLRWLESVIAVSLLAVSMGMPAITFREVAARHEPETRAAVLRRTLQPAAICAAVLLGVAVVWWFSSGGLTGDMHLLALCAGLMLPANAARVCIGYIQGASEAGVYVWRLMWMSAAGLACLLALTAVWGLQGWIAGRYVAEIGLAAGLMWALRSVLRRRAAAETAPGMALWRSGATINVAFLVRVLCDNLPLILMGWLGVARSEMGYFGLAYLVMMGPLLLLTTYAQNMTPRLVQASDSGNALQQVLRTMQLRMLGLAGLSGLGLALLIGGGLHAFGGAYREAGFTVVIVAAALPARALALAWGAAFVARAAYAQSLKVSAIECAVLASAFASVSPSGANAVAGIVVLASWTAVAAAAWLWHRFESV